MKNVKWQRQKYMPCLPLGNRQTRITECEEHIQLSRRAAAEGAVLLKNEGELLPLDKGVGVAIFGKAQIDYVKGGGGSGNTNVSYVRNIYQGICAKGDKLRVFEPLSFYYREYVKAQYAAGAENGIFDEAEVPADLLEKARAFTDTAIITLCRYSSEGKDRKGDKTDPYFYLSGAERQMVEAVTDRFSKVVILLNVGAMIDTSWFAYNPKISAALMLWQGGMEGGLAAADLLTGDVTPSGKLVDTCAVSLEDYPSTSGFYESDDYVKYTEDIFVGYRYFETVPGKKERVVYPFGYGLSYTTFSIENPAVFRTDGRITVAFSVTNTGKRAGREVVQLYYSAPRGLITKPARELCGFAKTGLLEPGQRQELSVSFAISDMASYDEYGAVAKSCYVLEKGTYRFYLGTDVRTCEKLPYTYELSEHTVTERLRSLCAPEKLDRVLLEDGSYSTPECGPVARKTFPCTYRMAEAPGEPHSLLDVYNKSVSLDSFVAQLTDDELCHLAGGQPGCGVSNTSGMGQLPGYDIPLFMTADGPAGLRTFSGSRLSTTAFPVATALACTWDTELMEKIGRAGAMEVKENNVAIWLTPALNIHRSPLCGRNFEYFSEDPFLTGKMAAAKIRGIQSQHIAATPKHLAVNNKETNRKFSDSIVSERALREIYLRAFEICVKEANPKAIMTSYNLINGVPASENAELIYGILRGEWGYRGMITTDWDNNKSHVKEVKAGNDVKMSHGEPEKLKEALSNGELSREELAVCVKRILELFLWIE